MCPPGFPQDPSNRKNQRKSTKKQESTKHETQNNKKNTKMAKKKNAKLRTRSSSSRRQNKRHYQTLVDRSANFPVGTPQGCRPPNLRFLYLTIPLPVQYPSRGFRVKVSAKGFGVEVSASRFPHVGFGVEVSV